MLTDEQRAFLIELQEELNTQDTVGQADPRFWVVRQKVAVPCPDDWDPDFYEFVTDDGDSMEIETDESETVGSVLELIGLESVEMLRPMRYENAVVPDTMFLTLRECREHIEANHYHYKKPHPYAMTAWRSPQVEKLIQILQTADWGDA